MKALSAQGVIMLVFGFLSRSLGLSPIGNVSANTDDVTPVSIGSTESSLSSEASATPPGNGA